MLVNDSYLVCVLSDQHALASRSRSEAAISGRCDNNLTGTWPRLTTTASGLNELTGVSGATRQLEYRASRRHPLAVHDRSEVSLRQSRLCLYLAGIQVAAPPNTWRPPTVSGWCVASRVCPPVLPAVYVASVRIAPYRGASGVQAAVFSQKNIEDQQTRQTEYAMCRQNGHLACVAVCHD